MTAPKDAASADSPVTKLARRDWVLLPLLALLTVSVMAISAELIARRFFSESTTSLDSCLVLSEPATGIRGIPNSVCSEKTLESPLVEYRLDGAGFRSGPVHGSKPAGVYRIVLIGSSVAMGERVPFEKSLAALLPEQLSRQSGRKIELYNEGMAYGFPRNSALRFQDVLRAEPDLILWVLTPMDIEKAGFSYVKNSFSMPAPADGPLGALKNAILDKIRKNGGTIVVGNAMRHWLYEVQSQSQYIHSYLLNKSDDSEAGFLRAAPGPEWAARVKEFATYAADIEERAESANVPFVATFAPNRAQAAMISLGEWPAGYDPYRLDADLRSVVTGHGGTYLDILPQYRMLPNPEHFYYPLDGHPDAAGYAVLAGLLANALGEAVPELRAASGPPGGSNRER
jgi:hypothetical protein